MFTVSLNSSSKNMGMMSEGGFRELHILQFPNSKMNYGLNLVHSTYYQKILESQQIVILESELVGEETTDKLNRDHSAICTQTFSDLM